MIASYCTRLETLLNAIPLRHSVRSYKDTPIDPQAVKALEKSIAWLNMSYGLHIQLVLDEPAAFDGWHSYGKFKGVRNYIVMAGPRGFGLDQKVGYCGEQLVLHAQALGLNTCWVGMTYKKVHGAFHTLPGEKVACVIAVGYGLTQGVAHPMKSLDDVCLFQGQKGARLVPDWFVRGAKAALLAPSAVNQQKFVFEYVALPGALPGVQLHKGFSMFGYTQMDMGIARLHFELGAAPHPFYWAGSLEDGVLRVR